MVASKTLYQFPPKEKIITTAGMNPHRETSNGPGTDSVSSSDSDSSTETDRDVPDVLDSSGVLPEISRGPGRAGSCEIRFR